MTAPLPIVEKLRAPELLVGLFGVAAEVSDEAADIIAELYEALDALNDHWNGVGDYDTSPDDEARLQEKVRAALRKARGEVS